MANQKSCPGPPQYAPLTPQIRFPLLYMYMHKQQLLSQRPPPLRLVHQCPPCTPLALSVKTSVIFSQFRCVAVAWHENSMDWTRAHPQCYMRQRGVPRGGAGRKKCERVNYMASPILAGKRTTRQDKPIAGRGSGCSSSWSQSWGAAAARGAGRGGKGGRTVAPAGQ